MWYHHHCQPTIASGLFPAALINADAHNSTDIELGLVDSTTPTKQSPHALVSAPEPSITMSWSFESDTVHGSEDNGSCGSISPLELPESAFYPGTQRRCGSDLLALDPDLPLRPLFLGSSTSPDTQVRATWPSSQG